MRAHTPGPYASAYDNGGGGRTITTVVRGETLRIGHTARVVFGGEEYVSEVAAKATADLFAAGPDYYDAVELALMTNGGPIEAADTVDGQPYVMVRRDAFDALVAAHAKAEGR